MNMYDRFVGVWRLNDWKMVRGGDILDPPIGPASECEGVLIYTPDRYMSVTISLRNRPHFATGSFDGGTDAEKRRAYETFFSYFGKCEVDEARKIMTHLCCAKSRPPPHRTRPSSTYKQCEAPNWTSYIEKLVPRWMKNQRGSGSGGFSWR